jgi:hypothetical protein
MAQGFCYLAILLKSPVPQMPELKMGTQGEGVNMSLILMILIVASILRPSILEKLTQKRWDKRTDTLVPWEPKEYAIKEEKR